MYDDLIDCEKNTNGMGICVKKGHESLSFYRISNEVRKNIISRGAWKEK